MHTLDPHLEHIIATAKEKLQDQLIYLEDTLKKSGDVRTTPIYGLIFFISGTSLHYSGDPNGFLPVDSDSEINAVTLLRGSGFDSVERNNLANEIMDWFNNPTFQHK
jgi:hypothetical protein